MTKETDEKKEQSKTAHIQDHLNQLLAEEDHLTEGTDSQTKKEAAIVHTEVEKKVPWRQRLVNTIRTFYSDDGEALHMATPAELKEMDESTKSKRQLSLPVLDTMEQQGMMTIAGLLVIAGLLGFLVSSWGSISTYKVKGNQEVTTAQLLDKLDLDKGQSSLLLLTEEKALTKKAHQFDPQIQKLKFTLKSPTVLEVKVTEIPSVGYLKEKDLYVPLLADGTRLTDDAKKWPAENFPVYSDFKSDEQLDGVLESFGTLSLALRQAVSEVIWSPTSENSSRLIFVMNDGNQVLANAENFEKKFKYYPGMATQLKKNGVIDLQVGAYAKPY